MSRRGWATHLDSRISASSPAARLPRRRATLRHPRSYRLPPAGHRESARGQDAPWRFSRTWARTAELEVFLTERRGRRCAVTVLGDPHLEGAERPAHQAWQVHGPAMRGLSEAELWTDWLALGLMPAYEARPERPDEYDPGTALGGVAAHAGWDRYEFEEIDDVAIQPSG